MRVSYFLETSRFLGNSPVSIHLQSVHFSVAKLQIVMAGLKIHDELERKIVHCCTEWVYPDLRTGPATRGGHRPDSARRLHSGHRKTQHTKQDRHDAPRHTQSEPLPFRSGAFLPSHLIAAAILCWVFSASFEISRDQLSLDNFRKRGPLTRCGWFSVFP